MLAAVELVAVADRPELAEAAGQGSLRLARHEPLGVEPVADQVGDADQPQPVVAGVIGQLGQPGHGAIGVLDLADHPGRIETRQAGQVDRRLGVACPFEHPSLAGPQGEDMAGTAQITRSGVRMDRHLDRPGPVFGGDARAHSLLRTRIHAHREGGLVAVGVAIHHQGQIQGIEPLPLHGQADQSPGVGGHEVDLLGCGELGRTDQVTFVLPVLVIDHHDRFPVADGRQGIGDGVEMNARGGGGA